MNTIAILLGYIVVVLAFSQYKRYRDRNPRIEQEYRNGDMLTTYVWHKSNIVYSSYIYNMKDQSNKLELEQLEFDKAAHFISNYRALEIGKK